MTSPAEAHERAVEVVASVVRDAGLLPGAIFTEAFASALTLDGPARELALRRVADDDPDVAERTVRTVNATLFGTTRRARDLLEALELGGAPLVSAVLVATRIHAPFRRASIPGLDLDRFAAFAVQVGRLSQRFGDERGVGDEALVAGMLLDVGKLVLALHRPADFVASVERAVSERVALHVIEQSVLGVAHPEVGAVLLELWGLPPPIVRAVRFHHAPGSATADRDLVACVHAADALLGILNSSDADGVLDLEVLRELGLDARLQAWQEEARQLTARGAGWSKRGVPT